jgi:hypothetical protein
MAGVITLQEVTIELKQSNVTLEKIEDTSVLTNEFLNLSVDTFKQGFGELLEFFKGNSLANLEKQREQDEFNKDLLAALQDLKPNDVPQKEEKKIDEFGLGGLLTGLAIAIGAVIGVIKGQLQAIKLFAKALMPAKWLDKIRKVFTSFVAGLSMSFDLLKKSLMDKLAGVGKFLTGVFSDIAKFFSGESKLFAGLKNVFTTMFQPFKELFSMVKGLLSGPFGAAADMFSGIGKTLSSFGAMIGKVAGIVGKIFLPLTIIMTVWDTVKGAIEGFEKDGIIGAIGGAVKGFFNSLIFGPLDMLKDATAWVLGFFGFDKAKEFLKSFSFEKIFSSIIDAITSPFETLKNIMSGVVTFFTDIGSKISGFFTNFEIPGFSILGKKFGPWKPFSSNKEETTTAAPTASAPKSPAAATSTTAPSATQQAQAPTSAVGAAQSIRASAEEEAYKAVKSAIAGGADPKQIGLLTDVAQRVTERYSTLNGGKLSVQTAESLADKAATRASAEARGLIKPKASTPTTAPAVTQQAQAPTTGGVPGAAATPSAASGKITNGEELKIFSDAYDRARSDGASVKEAKIIANEHLAAVRARKAMEVGTPMSSGMAVQSGQTLQTAGQENGMLSSMPARNGGGAGGGGVQQNNSTTVVNNSTVVVKPIPSASRRPNNSEDIFFGGYVAA